jgi:hypothetical protein
MRKIMTGFGVLTFGLLLISMSGETGQRGKIVVEPESDYGNIPLYFIPNRGQVDREALFYAKASGYTLWMTKEGLIFDAIKREAEFERGLSSLVFQNANPEAELMSCEPTEHRVSYFFGNDPSQWRTDIPTSSAVLYGNIYRNIDLKVYGLERQLEYDWVIRPGGKPESIRFKYSGLKATRIDKEGDLIIESTFGGLRHRKPKGYQTMGGKRYDVEVAFRHIGQDGFGFAVENFNPAYDLVIDPVVLVYSTYLGGSGTDYFGDSYSLIGGAIAVDSSGAAYITGQTDSTNFPTKTAYQKTNIGTHDVFITKLSPSGKSLVYSTYLGGFYNDSGEGIAIDNDGAAYVAGSTFSTNFPLKNAFQTSNRGGVDAFVTKLSPTGQALEYSTYLGGANSDGGNAIAVDGNGAAYITGSTWSIDFPTKTARQKTNRGKLDAFVTKLSPTGQTLEYSTFLGGAENDSGHGIAVDSKRMAYVTGATRSGNFPLKEAFQKTKGTYGEDAFLTKLSSSGKSLIYSTYLGGESVDWGYSIAVDKIGAAYLAGVTGSTDFPAKTPFQKTLRGNVDAFVTKFSSSGQTLEYSTFLGGTDVDYGGGIAVDGNGAAWVTGGTNSKNFPLKDAYQKTNRGKSDVFIANLSSTGKSLVYSTYLGGTGEDYGTKVALDGSGAAYLTGGTKSTNFPTKDAFQKTNRGGYDAIVSKVSLPAKSAKSKAAR